MSGFSADWLALREGADHRARDAGLAARAAGLFAGRAGVAIVDLGSGAGSNLRAFAPLLPARQIWTLVDHDPALLSAARRALAGWADRAADEGGDLRLERAGKTIRVVFRRADLAADPAAALDGAADLVTAAALFDLVSVGWIERFADALAARRIPLYAALTYDGTESWFPPHPADADMLAAFAAHQAGDKGFGPAAGAGAIAALRAALAARAYRVETAESPWRLGEEEADLVAELAKGTAKAARETGRLAPAAVASWRAARLERSHCVIGHTDLLASAP